MSDAENQTPIEPETETQEPPADESPFEIQPLDIEERSRNHLEGHRRGD